MKFRDKEKKLLSDLFIKTGEYILSLIVLGQALSQRFSFGAFIGGLIFFIVCVILSLFFSSLTKEE